MYNMDSPQPDGFFSRNWLPHDPEPQPQQPPQSTSVADTEPTSVSDTHPSEPTSVITPQTIYEDLSSIAPVNHDINDFVLGFVNSVGYTLGLRPTTNWINIIDEPNSIFNGFSYLIRYLFTLIDSILPSDTITIKGIVHASQKCDICAQLSNLDIYHIVEERTENLNHLQLISQSHDGTHVTMSRDVYDICIDTSNFWTVLDLRWWATRFSGSTLSTIYHNNIDTWDQFYNSISFISYQPNSSRQKTSLQDYLKFKTLINTFRNIYATGSPILASQSARIYAQRHIHRVARVAASPAAERALLEAQLAEASAQEAAAHTEQPSTGINRGQGAEGNLESRGVWRQATAYFASRARNNSTSRTISPLVPSHNTHTSNHRIKHHLADIIYDIKDTLSDSVYKELLENIAKIKN